MNPETSSDTSDVLVGLLADGGVPLDVLRLAGRLHPTLVHFPIALLIAAALLELLRRKGRDRPARGAYACLFLGAAGGAAAAVAGWLNAALEPHSRSLAETLTNHRWLGVATAAGALIAFAFATLQRFGWQGAAVPYRATLLLSALLVVPTGHLGGTLVFGEGYLTEVFGGRRSSDDTTAAAATSDVPAPPAAGSADAADRPEDPPAAAPPPAPGLALYRQEVRPILDAHCVECHGPDKRKGGLRLDVLDEALDPEIGVILPGDPEGSYLLELVSLPPDDIDRMPAEGPPLTDDEVASLRRWIAAGAPHERSASASPAAPAREDAPADDTGAGEAPAGEAHEETAAASPPLGEAVVRALEAVRARGGHAMRVGLDSTDVEVSFSRRGEAGDDALDALAGLEEALTVLRLDRTAVTDAGVARIAERFPRLRRLDLSGTGVGDTGAAALAGHPSLVVLNLYGSAVTDAGVARLAELEPLERVYLWGSGATADGVEALRAARPDLMVEFGDLAGEVATVVETAAPVEEAEGAANSEVTPAPCCAKAAAAGSECTHPCCVAAREAGEPVCVKCGGKAGE